MDEADSAGSYHLKIIEEGEGYRLLTASLFQVENEDYFLLTETDVSEIFQLRRSQFQFAIWMSILCSAAASIVLLLILHFLLKPLDRINRTVDVIASGNYDERFSEGGSSEFQELSQNLNRSNYLSGLYDLGPNSLTCDFENQGTDYLFQNPGSVYPVYGCSPQRCTE